MDMSEESKISILKLPDGDSGAAEDAAPVNLRDRQIIDLQAEVKELRDLVRGQSRDILEMRAVGIVCTEAQKFANALQTFAVTGRVVGFVAMVYERAQTGKLIATGRVVVAAKSEISREKMESDFAHLLGEIHGDRSPKQEPPAA
jgi:hypothetical protein